MREAHARPVCGRCERVLASRGAEDRRHEERILTALTIQRRLSGIVDNEGEQRQRLEAALATLWAPLHHPGAARPVLAQWFCAPGWRCAFEARHAVGTKAPLGQLPMRCRVVTLIAMGDLFGLDLHVPEALPAAAARLFRQAAPRGIRLHTQTRPFNRGSRAPKRSSADYLRLAQVRFGHRDWVAAEGLPERARQRVRARLIDAALATTAARPWMGEAWRGSVQ